MNMTHATYQGRAIDLSTISREMYQSLHEESLGGKIQCTSCKYPVHLYLGIKQQPHFYHIEQSLECTATPSIENQKEEVPTKQDGIHLPKTVSIGSSTPVLAWKKQKSVKIVPTFQEPTNKTSYELPNEPGFLLDEKQYDAATTIEGPLLLLAGAGSGKTRVLTARTAYMIAHQQIPAKSIMLVTFTAKSAKEMKERLYQFSSLSKQDINNVVIGTFHSIFYKIIAHHDSIRWSSERLLKYEWQREKIIKEIGREMNVDEKEFAFDVAMQQIGYWKNTLTSYEEIEPKDEWEERVRYLYKRYEEKKIEFGYFDFDDMLLGCYELLKENKELLARYQQRFHYFLIDEYQDINTVQDKIMRMLSSKTKNLCIVGDENQSIYAFRGSDPSFILEFDKEYPDAKIITLDENYRSSHRIVSAANSVISFNKHRRKKEMTAQHDNLLTPLLFYPYDEEEEATMIVQDIQEHMAEGAHPSDFAILYRTNTASRALFERLSQSDLPFTLEKDAESFYERRMVKSLLSYLRLSENEEDPDAIGDLLTSLFLKQSALQDLKAISILDDCSYVQALAKLPNLASFQQRKLQKIAPLFKKLKKMNPMAAITMVEKDMGFSEFIKKRGNEGNKIDRGSDDIRDLKVIAKKFTTISTFLTHIMTMIQKNKELKKKNNHLQESISLLTIHRSKGLEYKHIYILGAVDGSLPHDYALESFRNGDELSLEEERRLLYVAITRAQETLSISILQTRRGRTCYPSRFLHSLH